jgi:hypothetical protein
MPNPILRAGPFASSSDSFLDEPDPIVATTVPVNCATNDWANDTWKAYTEVLTVSGGVTDPNGEDREDYEGTLPDSFSYNISSVGNQSGRIQFAFRYQAAVDFDINVDAEANADGNLQSASASVQVSVNGTLVVDEQVSSSGAVSASYDNDITLPASVTPALVAIIVSSSTNPTGPVTTSADASLEISLPT